MSNNNNGSSSNNNDSLLLPPLQPGVQRHVLAAEEELRLEISFSTSNAAKQRVPGCILTLQEGSCELFGVELAIGKPYMVGFGGGLKLALFTWHGCIIDVDSNNRNSGGSTGGGAEDGNLEISYTSDETVCNIAYVNTHAQLEALRDQAVAVSASDVATSSSATAAAATQGPRVLICGGKDSGKTSLCKILTAYACKVGRTPILVDLDPADNMLSVPGTIAACPMNLQALSVEAFATSSGQIPPPGTASPLVLWHGTAQVPPLQQLDLFQQQVDALADKINRRLDSTISSGGSSSNNAENGEQQQQQQQQYQHERTSGIIVNTNAYMIQDEGYPLLLHTIQTFQISIVLVMGHDRLYSMLNSSLKNAATATAATQPKIIKLPRSGGVVSRNANFLRQSKSRSMKRYFYGDMVEQKPDGSTGGGGAGNTASSSSAAASSANIARGGGDAGTATMMSSSYTPQLTPFLLQIPLDQVQIYQYTSISLSASLLPMGAAQATEAVQLTLVNSPQEMDKQQQDNTNTSSSTTTATIQQKLSHHLLAVCHPSAVAAFNASGRAADLYTSGVAGFVSVERIVHDKIHFLTPCAGSLPSNVLLLGDVTWME